MLVLVLGSLSVSLVIPAGAVVVILFAHLPDYDWPTWRAQAALSLPDERWAAGSRPKEAKRRSQMWIIARAQRHRAAPQRSARANETTSIGAKSYLAGLALLL